jgi:hypothetical protein
MAGATPTVPRDWDLLLLEVIQHLGRSCPPSRHPFSSQPSIVGKLFINGEPKLSYQDPGPWLIQKVWKLKPSNRWNTFELLP